MQCLHIWDTNESYSENYYAERQSCLTTQVWTQIAQWSFIFCTMRKTLTYPNTVHNERFRNWMTIDPSVSLPYKHVMPLLNLHRVSMKKLKLSNLEVGLIIVCPFFLPVKPFCTVSYNRSLLSSAAFLTALCWHSLRHAWRDKIVCILPQYRIGRHLNLFKLNCVSSMKSSVYV